MSNDFFSGLLSSISERGRTLWRRSDPSDAKQDALDLIELCDALLSGAGEASGTAIAREVLDRYHHLDQAGRVAFFRTLARNYGPDQDRLQQAIEAWRTQPTGDGEQLLYSVAAGDIAAAAPVLCLEETTIQQAAERMRSALRRSRSRRSPLSAWPSSLWVSSMREISSAAG